MSVADTLATANLLGAPSSRPGRGKVWRLFLVVFGRAMTDAPLRSVPELVVED